MKKFKAHSQRLLEMMINSVYSQKEIFLRELISNASDAIDKARFFALTNAEFESDFAIKIDKSDRVLIVSDNGIGMNEADLENNLGTIAESGTAAFKSENSSTDEKLIGQFGVGFYSSFMVADKIEVISRKQNEGAFLWTSDATGYTIEPYNEEFSRGTTVKLHLKKPDEDLDYDELLDSFYVDGLIAQYSDYIRYPIYVFGADKPSNSMVPIWKRAKEAKQEELDEYFRHKFAQIEPPLKTLAYSVEGAVSYRALLFMPKKPPIDYFSGEYERGISLYNSGVMIIECCKELLPDYLGFIKGVIETEDISLNISRELMQKDRNLAAICKNIEKKVLGELEKMLANERDEYERFFNEFGASIKLGIYSGFGARKNELKNLLLYYSSSLGGFTTLQEYVDRLGEGGEILYACGEDINSISHSPALEAITKSGKEVLYLTDKIDEFVIKILGEFGGKPIKSVLEIEADSGKKEEISQLEEENKQLLGEIKEILGERVSKVRLTDRLTDHASILTSGNSISLQMEKVLYSVNKENKAVAERILELNPNHDAFNKLKNLSEIRKDLALVLYFEALLLSGLPLTEPYEFCAALDNLIKHS